MIDLMALFTGATAEVKPGKAASAGQGGGLFAALISALKPGANGEVALPQGLGGLVQKIAAAIEGAEQALAVPDLSDAEIGDILDTLVEELAGMIAAQPQVAAQLTGALALLVEPMADPTVAAEMPPRLLAEALPALREAIAVAGVPETAEETPGLQPLLTRIAAMVEEKQGAGRQATAVLPDGAALRLVPGVQAESAPKAAPAALAATVSPVPLVTEAVRAAPQADLAPLPPVTAAHAPSPVAQHAHVQQAPAAPPLPVEPREVLAQVRAQVGEQGRIRVELRPDGLGAVEVDIAPDEAGQLRVVVRAESPAVLNALRGDRDGLLMMLRGAGHDVQDGAMSFGDFGQGRDGQPGATGQGWSPVLGNGEATAEEAPARPALMLAGGVDITV